METLGEGLKKIILAGIGTAAVTAEKSKEILDDMVKKGELTVEQGKVLNQELKHNIRKTMKETVDNISKDVDSKEMDDLIEKMTPEQIEKLKEKLNILAEEKKTAEETEKILEDAEE